jgi:membrane protease YdiL (CAAX protease family)
MDTNVRLAMVAQGEALERPGKKGPVVVWLFVLVYWALVSFLTHGPSSAQLPSTFTPSVLLGLVASILLQYGPVLLFLFLFVWFYERRRGRGLLSLFSSVGWNRVGVKPSLKWALAFFVVAIPVGLLMLLLESAVAHSGAEHLAGSTSSAALPLWYIPFAIVLLAADVVTEETVVRGYILDRLMPAHPSSLRQSLAAVLVTSMMMSSYHLVPYLYTYGFAAALTGVNLVADFLYSILVCFAYIKSRAKNVSGPILFHLLLDLPMMLGA